MQERAEHRDHQPWGLLSSVRSSSAGGGKGRHRCGLTVSAQGRRDHLSRVSAEGSPPTSCPSAAVPGLGGGQQVSCRDPFCNFRPIDEPSAIKTYTFYPILKSLCAARRVEGASLIMKKIRASGYKHML